jgi:Zn-dependent protease with chaperone function
MNKNRLSITCINCHAKNNLTKTQSLNLTATKTCAECDTDLFPFYSAPFLDLSAKAFTHDLDHQMLEALKTIPGVDSLLRSLIKHSFELSMRLHHQGNFLKASPKQAKNIYKKLEEAALILDIRELPELYIMPDARISAYTFGVENCSIAISSGCLESFSLDEVTSVLAHELGHIKAGHVLYKIASRILATLADSIAQKTLGVGGLLLYPIKIALLRWDRASELSSDRASLLVVKNPAVVLNSLMKLAGGSSALHRQLDIKAFIEQAERYEKTQTEGPLGKYIAIMDSMFNTHPFPIWRAQEIIEWVESGDYFKILQGNYPKRSHDSASEKPTTGFTVNQALGSLKSWYDEKFSLPKE